MTSEQNEFQSGRWTSFTSRPWGITGLITAAEAAAVSVVTISRRAVREKASVLRRSIVHSFVCSDFQYDSIKRRSERTAHMNHWRGRSDSNGLAASSIAGQRMSRENLPTCTSCILNLLRCDILQTPSHTKNLTSLCCSHFKAGLRRQRPSTVCSSALPLPAHKKLTRSLAPFVKSANGISNGDRDKRD